ncbi:MAG: helix-turn-helix domain-containing protein [Myxococcales bacterium]
MIRRTDKDEARNPGARKRSPSRAQTRTRARGRPPKTAEGHAEMRRTFLEATRRVFAREGYHALSVELVLREAGLSRPTFYKYFESVDAAIDVVLREVNDDLIESLLSAISSASAPYDKLEAALLAWRSWGERLGPMLRPLFAELHDPHSPASRHRKRTQRLLAKHFLSASEAIGRPAPAPLMLETLIQGMEFLGYRYHFETKRDAESWRITREAMLRLAFGMLATEPELAHAVPLLRAANVRLSHEERTP